MSATVDKTLRRKAPATWSLKVTMAVTGVIWVLFVLIHLFGNLKVFGGADSYNAYALWLREAFYPFLPKESVLWTMRVVLVAALLAHVLSAATLWLRGRRAGSKQTRFAVWRKAGDGKGRIQALSAAMMPVTGIVILVFLPFHIMDLTTGTEPVASADFAQASASASSAYENLIASFTRPWVALIYMAVMALLSLHVLHGVTTASSDLGVIGRRPRQVVTWIAGLCALAILLGNGAIPLLVQMGVLT